MDTPIFQALEEWGRLETAHYNINCVKGAEDPELALFALQAKTAEILKMRAQTRNGALAHLRLCATCLERSDANRHLAVAAIRNAVNILGWRTPATCSRLSPSTED